MYQGEVEHEVKQAGKLVEGRIIRVIFTEDKSAWGFIVWKDGAQYVVWVDADPEGNGPGHLDIQLEKSCTLTEARTGAA